MKTEALERFDRRVDRAARLAEVELRPVVDEYGMPTGLVMESEPMPVVEPSERALEAQAFAIAQAAYEARIAAEDSRRFAVERARLRRDAQRDDVVYRARHREGGFARAGAAPVRRRPATSASTRRVASSAITRSAAIGPRHPCPGIGCDGRCG